MPDSPTTTAEPTDATIPGRTYDVPEGAEAHDCPYCVAVFPQEELRDLHVGIDHEDVATEDELETFEDRYERESNDVFIYHLKAIALVVVIYFVFLFAYGAIAGA